MPDTYDNITGLTPEEKKEHERNINKARLMAALACILVNSTYGVTATPEGHPYLDPRVLEDVDD